MFFSYFLRITLCACLGISVGWWGHTCVASENTSEEGLRLESGFYYTVEKRDTLWDISEHFYDYAWLWPDLWEKNPHIKNPHLIYPGERIRLFSRHELQALLEAKGEAEIPSMPVEPAYYLYPAIDSVGFIREQVESPSGVIFKFQDRETGITLTSEGSVVYIRPAEGMTLEVGDRFTVFRAFRPTGGVEERVPFGIQHEIAGVIEIADVEPEFAVGTIVHTFWPIVVNDLLMPYEGLSPKIMLAESQEGLEGKIILSEKHQEIIGDHTVVFIDKGRKDGVRPGQSYSVYYQDRATLDPQGTRSFLLPPVDIGEILILRAEETTATALVTMAAKPIHPGEKIRYSSQPPPPNR